MSYKLEERIIPVIPLRGLSIFPHMILHFDIGRDKSINALEEAMENDSLVFLTTQKEPDVAIPKKEDLNKIGTVCKIKQMLKLPADTIRVLVEGINRAQIIEVTNEDPYFEAEIEELIYEEEVEKDIETRALMRMVLASFEDYVNTGKKISSDVLDNVDNIDEPGKFADTISSYISLTLENKQKILETFDPKERLEALEVILKEEIEILRIEVKIAERVKSQINKIQKEHYLREQVKAIQKELGEDESVADEADDFKTKIENLGVPQEVKEKALKEIKRLSTLPPSSPETGIIRNYLNWITELPWNEETKDTLDLKKSREILDRDHYGLQDVKERILEYLGVRKLSNSLKGPIICLVGPPGVGKTSIAKSIAASMDKKFIRMSLGGVRDESEIRGHRRTYVGAMPGKIISSLKKVESKNPVFLLDEIDKMSGDFRGDPASALLEVLDPEQNATFTDHFLEFPFDLSKIMFITTANSLNTIPRPLLDRMEIIRVSGYTEEEKLQIAKKYLLPKQKKENGLSEDNLNLSDNTLKDIITNYTREAGVRGLERELANICRKSAKRIVEEDVSVVRINSINLSRYLGVPKFSYEMIKEDNQIGIVRGLAWTSVGGDTLSIEVTSMTGTGKIQLTGKLGDVMKESAMTGISYVRSRATELGIDENFYKNKDIHIHVPEGATPKDGPSAGISMATAVISALSETPVYRTLAMTGEITLRGRVLAVGGIKEKVLAAQRAGITKILLPFESKKEMEDIPNKAKREIEFVFVKDMEEVLDHALVKEDDKNEN